MGPKAIGGGGLYVGDEVLGCSKVDKGLGTELLGTHLFLGVAGINGDCAYPHGICVLYGERSETTTSTDNGCPLAGPDTRLLQALVDGDTGAKNGRNSIERQVLGNASDMCGFGNAVLLECAVDGIPGEEGLGAKRLIGLLAKVTSQAGAVQPLDTSVVADFDISDELTAGNDYTSTFVATDKR